MYFEYRDIFRYFLGNWIKSKNSQKKKVFCEFAIFNELHIFKNYFHFKLSLFFSGLSKKKKKNMVNWYGISPLVGP